MTRNFFSTIPKSLQKNYYQKNRLKILVQRTKPFIGAIKRPLLWVKLLAFIKHQMHQQKNRMNGFYSCSLLIKVQSDLLESSLFLAYKQMIFFLMGKNILGAVGEPDFLSSVLFLSETKQSMIYPLFYYTEQMKLELMVKIEDKTENLGLPLSITDGIF